jgi:uncharacterized protein YjlB
MRWCSPTHCVPLSPAAHAIPQGQVEQVTVLSGRLGYMLGGATGTRGELRAGESISIPAGGAHQRQGVIGMVTHCLS